MKLDNCFDDVIDHMFHAGLVPFLLSGPGCGKSSHVEAFCEEHGYPCHIINCNTLADKGDFCAPRLVKTDDGEYVQKFYACEEITDAVKDAEADPDNIVVLFLDEINRTTPDVTSAALSLSTARTIGSTKLPDNLAIVCAGNDKGNVASLDSASLNRFTILHIHPDVQTYMRIEPKLDDVATKLLSKHPEYLYQEEADVDDDDDAEEMVQHTSPRSISRLMALFSDMTDQEIRAMATYHDKDLSDKSNGDSYLWEVIEGTCGHTQFALDYHKDLLNNIVNTGTSDEEVKAEEFTISRPKRFNSLKNAASYDDMRDIVDKMKDGERLKNLAYALYDDEDDNSDVIPVLADGLISLGDKNSPLMGLIDNKAYDEDNMDCLTELGTPFANLVASLL